MFSVFQVNWDSIRPDSELYVSAVCNKPNARLPIPCLDPLTITLLACLNARSMHKNSYKSRSK